jgi:cytochrome c553
VFIDAKCQTCHSVESHNLTSKSKKSTDLSNVGAVYRANFLEKFLMKQDKKRRKSTPAAFKGSNEDLFQLAEWLQTLNTGEINETNTGKKKRELKKLVKKLNQILLVQSNYCRDGLPSLIISEICNQPNER